jgi:hypothetical protein
VTDCNEKTVTMEISKTQAPHTVLYAALVFWRPWRQALFAGGAGDDALCAGGYGRWLLCAGAPCSAYWKLCYALEAGKNM